MAPPTRRIGFPEGREPRGTDKRKGKHMGKEGKETGLLHSRRMLGAIVASAMVLGVLGLAACTQGPSSSNDQPKANAENAAKAEAPAAASDQKQDAVPAAAAQGNAAAADAQAITMMRDFTNRDTGLYPNQEMQDVFINEGNRGCNACHADLWELTQTLVPAHLVTNTGYGKNGTIFDCLSCHSLEVGRTGVYFGDIIHTAHYSSNVFNEGGGTCWSCHAINSCGAADYDNDPGQLDYDIKLFEQVQYTPGLGGYINGTADAERLWVNTHRHTTDYVTGVKSTAALDGTLDMSQDPCAEEDAYVVENWGPVKDMMNWDEWTLDVQGVKNAHKVTLDELKAMPQTEITATQVCSVNGVNGGLASNIPIKGVLISDFIEAMGGLTDGANQMHMTSIDGWTGEGYDGIAIQSLIDAGAMIGLEYYGHELTFEQGYPCAIVMPGYGGSYWCKNLLSLTFAADPQASDPISAMATLDGTVMDINTGWLENDGVQAKVGQPLTLEGYTWAWGGLHEGGLKTIDFSADFGLNWQEIAVPDTYDDDQWVRWSYTWTPKEAGTYVLHAKGVADDGDEQYLESSLIVVVSE